MGESIVDSPNRSALSIEDHAYLLLLAGSHGLGPLLLSIRLLGLLLLNRLGLALRLGRSFAVVGKSRVRVDSPLLGLGLLTKAECRLRRGRLLNRRLLRGRSPLACHPLGDNTELLQLHLKLDDRNAARTVLTVRALDRLQNAFSTSVVAAPAPAKRRGQFLIDLCRFSIGIPDAVRHCHVAERALSGMTLEKPSLEFSRTGRALDLRLVLDLRLGLELLGAEDLDGVRRLVDRQLRRRILSLLDDDRHRCDDFAEIFEAVVDDLGVRPQLRRRGRLLQSLKEAHPRNDEVRHDSPSQCTLHDLLLVCPPLTRRGQKFETVSSCEDEGDNRDNSTTTLIPTKTNRL